MEKERLDILLRKRKLVRSRSRAKALIERGYVTINGKIVKKPSEEVAINEKIEVTKTFKYVSRAGKKLEKALEVFHIKPEGKVVLDVGSSTGGFVDCLLQKGAKKVIAVDTGTDQLVTKLKTNPRVKVLEQTDIRKIDKLDETPELATIDVSFISLTKVLSIQIYLSNLPKLSVSDTSFSSLTFFPATNSLFSSVACFSKHSSFSGASIPM